MNKKKTGQKYSNCKVIFIVRYLLVTSDTIRESKRQISIIFSLITQDGYEDELMGQCLRGVGIKPTITTDDEVIVIACIVLFVFCTVIFDTQQRKFNNNKTLYALQRQNAENLKQIFPEKEYRGLSPNFHIHVPVSELSIPTIGNMQTDPGNI